MAAMVAADAGKAAVEVSAVEDFVDDLGHDGAQGAEAGLVVLGVGFGELGEVAVGALPNTSEVLFRLCANTDPQRDSLFTKGPSAALDQATSDIASGSKLGIDATKKFPGEGFKRPWPPVIKIDSAEIDSAVKSKVEKLFRSG